MDIQVKRMPCMCTVKFTQPYEEEVLVSNSVDQPRGHCAPYNKACTEIQILPDLTLCVKSKTAGLINIGCSDSYLS